MIIDSRTQAVRNLYDNVVTIDGDDAFDKDHKKITLDESSITTEIKRLEDECDAQEYQRDRASEYPSITDVVVALAEKEEGDSTMWDDITAKRQAVKTKYKKG